MFNCIAIRGMTEHAADTFKTLWKHLVWSFYWLYQGVWPLYDVDGKYYTHGLNARRAGKPLAGGYFGVLWNLRFDIDAAQTYLRLADPRNNLHCFFCPAGKCGLRPWTDCRDPPNNTWYHQTYTNQTDKTWHRNNVHRMFRALPGFGFEDKGSLEEPIGGVNLTLQ